MKKKTYTCPTCMHDFNIREIQERGVCPICLTRREPMLSRQSGYIFLYWEQVRILTIYAKRWANTFDETKKGNQDAIQALDNAINSLRQYRPKDGEGLEPPEERIEQLEQAPNKPKKEGAPIPSPYFKKGTKE